MSEAEGRAAAEDAGRSAQLDASWRDNAAAWTEAVRAQAIESRRVATDAAILRAVLDRAPARTLDLGCGEGWLVRALAEHGRVAVGMDGSAPLIEAARQAGGGTYLRLGYDDIVDDPTRCGDGFDVVVANFALLDSHIVALLTALRRIMRADARLLIQTVHPLNVAAPYRDGWRVENFRGFGDATWTPMPWYFRTLASWVATLREGGFTLEGLAEPAHPDDGRPLSLIIEARMAPAGRKRRRTAPR